MVLKLCYAPEKVMNEHTNEQTNEQMNKQIKEQTNKQTSQKQYALQLFWNLGA